MNKDEPEVTLSRKRKQSFDNSDNNPEKKAKQFCFHTFRQELNGRDAIKSVKKFIAAAKNSVQVIYDFVEKGGSPQELLSLLDPTAAGDLTTALPVFEALHLIFIRLHTSCSKHVLICIETARIIIRSYLNVLKDMLSMNVKKQKEVALNLLASIILLDVSLANEIMNVIALSSTLIATLAQPSSERESVRKGFVLFVTSFLIEGNPLLIKNLIEKKSFLNCIIPGLKYDDQLSAFFTISLLEEKVLKNVKISKTLKLKLFNTQVIKSLFDLYDWKGPQGLKRISALEKENKTIQELELNRNEKESIINAVHSLLLLLCTSQKFGVAFHDNSMGTSGEIKNQLLLTVFESLTDPFKNPKISEVMVKSIASCPDIMKPVLNELGPSFYPRNSTIWFRAMEFAENLIITIDAVVMLKKEAKPPTAKQIIKVGKTLCAPEVLLKYVNKGLQKSQAVQTRLGSVRLLTVMWTELQRLLSCFKIFEKELKRSFYKHIYKYLPDPDDLIELWVTLCNTEFFNRWLFSRERKILFLSALLDSLHMVTKCQIDAMISPLNVVFVFLNSLDSIKGNMTETEYHNIQMKIVQFVELDFQGLTSNMESFEKTFAILFRCTDEASLSYLSKFLASLNIFKGNETELDVWLSDFWSLAPEYRSSVANFLIESIHLFFKREGKYCRKIKTYFEGEAEKGSQNTKASLTPLLFNCLEVFKSRSLSSPNGCQELQLISNYLSDVIIHLQHFYSLDLHLRDHLKGFKGLRKSILSYLKGWKNGFTKPVKAGVFSCSSEYRLVSWLISEEISISIEEIINVESVHLLKRYLFFRTVVAFLNSKIERGTLTPVDVGKFTKALLLLIGTIKTENDLYNVDLISSNIGSINLYQRHCLNCLFENKYLLNKFNIFKRTKSVAFLATDIILKVLINENVKKLSIEEMQTEPLKNRFLKRLKTQLKNNYSIDNLNNLEKVVNYFEYNHGDAAEMLELLMSVSDLNLFIYENTPSAWTQILSKFVKLYCKEKELCEVFVKKLCRILEHLRKENCSGVDILETCLVDVLRKHPRHLLFIDDEYLDTILFATNTSNATLILGKLLLNDPSKVRYFLRFIKENLENVKEPQIIYSLISAIIVNKKPFYGGWNKARSFLEIGEISETKTPDLYKALKLVYIKFEKNILQALAGEEDEVLKNFTFTRALITLFFGRKESEKLKENIFEENFEPVLLFEAVKKIGSAKFTKCYLRNLMKFFCNIIGKPESTETLWEKYLSIISEISERYKCLSWQSVYNAPVWKKFIIAAVKHCLKKAKCPSLLKIIRLLMITFYKSKPFRDCQFIFQMLVSHSKFLKVMLSDSPLKFEVVELYWYLIEKSSSEMASKHYPVLLASYSASLSPCDRRLLQIMRFYEANKASVNKYGPFVWGNSAISHYSIGRSSGLSLWQRFNMANILDLLDEERLELSLKEFPIHRTLESNQDIDCNSNVYDPAFLLNLFIELLSPGAVVFCLPFIYKGGLAFSVRALSSECKSIRLLASLVLSRFHEHLELTPKLKQKPVWMHFIKCFRFGVKNISEVPVSNIVTLFFARMTLALSNTSADMYLPLQKFLLAKPHFVLDGVPEFLPLFHSSEMRQRNYRLWLLEVIRDGTITNNDMKLVFHSMISKIVFCFFFSTLCDLETKEIILQVVEKFLKTDNGFLLFSEYGLLKWVTKIESGSSQNILRELLYLIYELIHVIFKDIQINRGKILNSQHANLILNFTIDLLPFMRNVKSVEDFKLYLKIIKEYLVFSTKKKNTKLFKIRKQTIRDIIETGIFILGKNCDCDKFCEVPFYFRDFNGDCGYEELKNSIFLFNNMINSR